MFANFSRPNIFWKMSKVSFREIVTMRTVDPVFKDVDLANLLRPQLNGSTGPETRGRLLTRSGTSGLPDSPESINDSTSVRQQIQNQGVSINRLSSTVSNLHDTMNELKHAFTALRLELSNSPIPYPSEPDRTEGGFDMLAAVLKELKNKSDEIDRLKLENEGMKLKIKYLEERVSGPTPSAPYLLEAGAPTEVHSPGLLNENGKRPWSQAYTNGGPRQIVMDSFDDEDNDLPDDISLGDVTTQSVKVPLKDPGEVPARSDTPVPQQTPSNPRLRVEVYNRGQDNPSLDAMAEAIGDTHLNTEQPRQPANKQPRLSNPEEYTKPTQNSTAEPEKRRPGRPKGWRRSTNQAAAKPNDPPQTPKPAPLVEQDVNVGSGSRTTQGGDGPAAANPSPDEPPSSKRRGRSRRRRSSRAPSVSSAITPARKSRRLDKDKQNDDNTIKEQDNDNNLEQDTTTTTATATTVTEAPPPASEPEPQPEAETAANENQTIEPSDTQPDPETQPAEQENIPEPKQQDNVPPEGTSDNTNSRQARERRKAQIAARDVLAKLAMQREEAMAEME